MRRVPGRPGRARWRRGHSVGDLPGDLQPPDRRGPEPGAAVARAAAGLARADGRAAEPGARRAHQAPGAALRRGSRRRRADRLTDATRRGARLGWAGGALVPPAVAAAGWLGNWAWVPSNGALMGLGLLYPDGRLPS